MAVPQSLFSPKQVAEALQVSESSVKRWCDQGLISMTKTAGGHRRISLEELLRFVNDSERPLFNPMAIGLRTPPPQPAQRKVFPSFAGSEEQVMFRNSLAEGDENQCRRILRSVAEQLGSPARAVELLITDAMHRFGEAWEKAHLDVYQERHGCEICLRLIHEVRAELPRPTGPVAIGGAPEHDPYQLPTNLVELTLREAGWQAHSLGANLPIDSFKKAAEHYQPSLIWMSVSVVDGESNFVDRFNAFADWLPDHCVLIVGGRALKDDLRPRLRYTAHCDNLLQLTELAAIMRSRRPDLTQSDN